MEQKPTKRDPSGAFRPTDRRTTLEARTYRIGIGAIRASALSCLAALVVAGSLAGCERQIGDYLALSSLAKHGFARDRAEIRQATGREIRVWGFVDRHNLFGDAGAKRVLGSWWSGDGPGAASWRFDLLANEEDEAGQGIQVRIPNDPGRDNLLRVFREDAESGRPTRVLVLGRLFAFDAPTNAQTLTGFYLDVRSSGDISIERSR